MLRVHFHHTVRIESKRCIVSNGARNAERVSNNMLHLDLSKTSTDLNRVRINSIQGRGPTVDGAAFL